MGYETRRGTWDQAVTTVVGEKGEKKNVCSLGLPLFSSPFPLTAGAGTVELRLPVVPNFSSGIVERAKRERA